MDDNRVPKKKKIKLQTWREKKYRKTTNEMGWFPGGRNRSGGLSLIVYDDDDDDEIIGTKLPVT